MDIVAVAGGYPRRFLAAVLETMKTEIGFMYCIRISENPENPAFFSFIRHRASGKCLEKKTDCDSLIQTDF
jgi:hypothetical protein